VAIKTVAQDSLDFHCRRSRRGHGNRPRRRLALTRRLRRANRPSRGG
jgi:hypothetical protein